MTDGTPPRDPITVHRGLLAVARDRNADFNAILVQYAIERLLDRLSRSTEDRRFVLKAMLFRGFGEDDGEAAASTAIAIVGRFALPALHAAAESGQSPGLWVPASGWRSKCGPLRINEGL